MEYKEMHKRFLAVGDLLDQHTTSRKKFESVRTLLTGINPSLDTLLTSCSKSLDHLTKLESGDIISLTAENIPETTEKEKKRKKALLLFLNYWKQLKGEVARIQNELEASHHQTLTEKSSSFGRIVSLAKGPLGLVTIVAVGIVVLNSLSAKITVRNTGCDPIVSPVNLPIPLPGLKLPEKPIGNGEQAVVTLLPVSFTVDGSVSGVLTFEIAGLKIPYNLPGIRSDLNFNGNSLIGRRTDIHLSGASNTLIISCS